MIAILRYNAGNIRSVENALDRAGYRSVITDDEKIIRSSEKVIIPGVGHAGPAMKYLRSKGLDRVIISLRQPVLGICLGLQLLCRRTEEDDTQCLGVFGTDVKRFPPRGIVPHMGWNNFTAISGPLFKGLKVTDNMYYVHSYYAEPGESTAALCEYLLPFSAAMQKDNFFATQFHPEKSSAEGEIVLKNFLEL